MRIRNSALTPPDNHHPTLNRNCREAVVGGSRSDDLELTMANSHPICRKYYLAL